MNNTQHMAYAGAIERYLDSREASDVLRSAQADCIHAIGDAWSQGEKAIFVDSPTGSGKTVIFISLFRALQQGLGYLPRGIILEPKNLLIGQTVDRFGEFCSDWGDIRTKVGVYNYKSKVRSKRITATTYQSSTGAFFDGRLNPSDYPFWIIDEAHKALSKRRLEVIQSAPNALQTAFTATPAYSLDRTLEEHFSLAYRLTPEEACDSGLISGIKNVLIESKVINLDEVSTHHGDFDKDDLTKKINITERNIAGIRFYQEVLKSPAVKFSGEKAIGFCGNIQHAKDVADLFNKEHEQVIAAALHSDQSPSERYDILQRYKRGEIKILTSADMLIEGFDDHETGIVLNFAPSKSFVTVGQRGGRGCRINPFNLSKICIVADIWDSNTQKNTGITYAEYLGRADLIPQHVNFNDNLFFKSGASFLGRKDIEDANSLNIDGLRVIFDEKEILTIARNRKLSTQFVSNLGPKSIEWFDKSQMRNAVGGDYYRIRKIYDDLIAQKQRGEQPMLDGQLVECGFQSSFGYKVFCIHNRHVSNIKKHIGRHREKTNDWLTSADVSRKYKIATRRTHAIFSDWRENRDNGRPCYLPETTEKVTVGYFWSFAKQAFCVHQSDAEKLAKILKPHAKVAAATSDWLSKDQMAKELRIDRNKVAAAYEMLSAQAAETDNAPKHLGQEVKIEFRRSARGNKEAYYVHRSSSSTIKALATTVKLPPRKQKVV